VQIQSDKVQKEVLERPHTPGLLNSTTIPSNLTPI